MTELVGLSKQATRKKQAREVVTKLAPVMVAGIASGAAGSNAPQSVTQTESLEPWLRYDSISSMSQNAAKSSKK